METETTTEPEYDADWMLEYRVHALEALAAGALMCLVSRITHILAKPGALRHEAYMSFYANLMTACLLPLLILA